MCSGFIGKKPDFSSLLGRANGATARQTCRGRGYVIASLALLSMAVHLAYATAPAQAQSPGAGGGIINGGLLGGGVGGGVAFTGGRGNPMPGTGANPDGQVSKAGPKAPEFVDFEVEPGVSGYLVWGTVIDEDGPVTGILIEFTGLLAGHSAVTDESGDFYFLTTELPHDYGWIGATAIDEDGNESEEVGRHL